MSARVSILTAMCGRFALNAHTDELIQEYVAAGGDFRDWRPSYSIAPTNRIPIVRERVDEGNGELVRTLDVVRWDFRPGFIDEKGKPNFNARIERLTTSGLWRGAFASSRALVPMRGYYEWTGPTGDKQPHFLHADSGGLLTAAGIYTARRDGDEWVLSAAIVTRPARDASGEIHDRMPVFLGRDVWDDYLAPGKLDADGKEHMIALLTEESERMAGTIATYEVDRKVNYTRGVDPADASLIAPVG